MKEQTIPMHHFSEGGKAFCLILRMLMMKCTSAYECARKSDNGTSFSEYESVQLSTWGPDPCVQILHCFVKTVHNSGLCNSRKITEENSAADCILQAKINGPNWTQTQLRPAPIGSPIGGLQEGRAHHFQRGAMWGPQTEKSRRVCTTQSVKLIWISCFLAVSMNQSSSKLVGNNCN